MKTILTFCLPVLVYGQSYVVSQNTSFTIEYAPIALIRLQSSITSTTAEVPAEAGECLLNTPLEAGTAQLFMSVSRHYPKEVRARIAANQSIETTGGRPNGNDITEIGIVHVEHNKITRSWSSFVKPDQSIPYNIQMLTGITDDMVANAPAFTSLAPELLKELEGEVFVAHSVNFDYSFIERAFKEAGINWRMPKLCTVKYAKAMFPEFGRYSLAHLTQALSVANDNPHRALSDALCAAEVLIHCCTADYDDKKLNDPKLGLLKRIQLPDLMPAHFYDELPKEAGVYQFLDAFGMPLYIGKAKNIKSRITQHFSTDQGATKYQRLMKECHSIGYEIFPNETLSLIYEDHLIRQHWPPLNKAQKKQALKFGLYSYENGQILVRKLNFSIHLCHH